MAEEKTDLEDWRVILSVWRDHASPKMIEELLEALDVNIRTLYRWMKPPNNNRPNKPDSRLKILVLEQYIPEIGSSLRKYFPQYYESSQDAILRAVAPFYVRVAKAATHTEKSFVLHTITRMVLSNLVSHVDIEQHGFVAMLVQLVSAQKNGRADQLCAHAWSSCGTGIWFEFSLQRSFAVHKNSLCGLAIMTGREAFYPRDQDHLIRAADIRHMNLIQSAAAYPLLRGGEVAGVIFMAAIQPDYFTHQRREIISHYVLMMDKAFQDKDFYPLSHVDIAVDERDAYQQFLNQVSSEYPDESHEQINARVVAMFREYSNGLKTV